MARPYVTIPLGLFRPLDFNWQIDWRTQDAGSTTDGITQTMGQGFPRWIGSPRIRLSRAQIATWRALLATAQGRRGLFLVEMADAVIDLPPYTGTGRTFASGVTFSNDRGFLASEAYALVFGKSAGDEQITVDTFDGLPNPVPGQILGHGLWPFEVTWVEPLSATRFRLGTTPLRAAMSAGDAIALRPRGVFEMVEDTSGNPAYARAMRSTVQLQFREWLNR